MWWDRQYWGKHVLAGVSQNKTWGGGEQVEIQPDSSNVLSTPFLTPAVRHLEPYQAA